MTDHRQGRQRMTALAGGKPALAFRSVSSRIRGRAEAARSGKEQAPARRIREGAYRKACHNRLHWKYARA